MNMKKIVNDYIDDLESKAKLSDKYFMERNKLYIEKEQIKEVIRKWHNMNGVSIYDIGNFLQEIDDIVFKPEIIQKEELKDE